MAGISGDLLKIDNTSVKGLKTYRVGSNLLWANAERNMNGDIRASYLGEYPKLELEFRDGLTQAEVTNIYNLLSSPFFTVTYYHPGTGNYKTGQYYRGDFSFDLLDKRRGLYKEFSVNLIPVSRRS